MDRLLTQCRVSSGFRPSPRNTWPRWLSQRAHRISVRSIPALRSSTSSTAPWLNDEKLGQLQWPSCNF